jgi:hypothetical protein
MSKPYHHWCSVFCGIIILVMLSISTASAERRVALVVGNSLYKNTSLTLQNPRNDAQDVAAVLRTLGFDVIVALDASKRDFDLALTQFARAAANADTALFYYAGHALQYQGRNYLMPVDAELEDEISVRFQTVWLDDVRSAIELTGGVKIMILDACRNNPIVDALKRKVSGLNRGLNLSRGLARIEKSDGMIIAYSTAADEVALDGNGRNSPFTTALLKRMQQPGLEIAKLFRLVAADVGQSTNGRQHPEIYVSLGDEYYLNQQDAVAWNQIKDSTDPKVFRDFIGNFPSSSRTGDAQYRLATLEQLTRERQAEKDQEAQRARQLQAEQERMQSEAAQRREAEEAAKIAQQKQAALQAEQDRAQRDAAQRRQAEDAAKVEQQKQAALQAEQDRAQRETAQRRQAEEAAKVQQQKQAALQAEQDRAQREATQRRQADEAARVQQQKQAALPAQPVPSPPPSASAHLPAASQEQNCERDQQRLTRIRANPAPDEIARFEQELGCEKLRPQIARLRESLGAADHSAAAAMVSPPAAPPAQAPEPPRQQAAKLDQSEAPSAAPPPSLSSDEVCRRDEERLVHLRSNPIPEEIARFERELGCARLRPQVVRLRESVGAN